MKLIIISLLFSSFYAFGVPPGAKGAINTGGQQGSHPGMSGDYPNITSGGFPIGLGGGGTPIDIKGIWTKGLCNLNTYNKMHKKYGKITNKKMINPDANVNWKDDLYQVNYISNTILTAIIYEKSTATRVYWMPHKRASQIESCHTAYKKYRWLSDEISEKFFYYRIHEWKKLTYKTKKPQ